MGTYILFKDGQEAHILEHCTGSCTLYKCLENGHMYERERTAVKRAILFNRKCRYNSTRTRRHRTRVKHHRLSPPKKSIPTIVTFFEDGLRRHKVVETGKIYKRIKNAIKNAIRYYTSK